jgi:hypothetical protein
LLLATEEPYPGRFPVEASVFLDGLNILIDLHLVQGPLLVFAVSLLKTSFVPNLTTLDEVAEATVEKSTVHFK